MRSINDRPERYYARCVKYCARRRKLAADDNAKWFWIATEQRFGLCKLPAARIVRFRDKPWRYPQFIYRHS